MDAISGKFMPITNAANIHTRPRTTSFQPLKFAFFWMRPNTAENAINRREMLPAAPLTLAASDNCVTPASVTV